MFPSFFWSSINTDSLLPGDPLIGNYNVKIPGFFCVLQRVLVSQFVVYSHLLCAFKKKMNEKKMKKRMKKKYNNLKKKKKKKEEKKSQRENEKEKSSDTSLFTLLRDQNQVTRYQQRSRVRFKFKYSLLY